MNLLNVITHHIRHLKKETKILKSLDETTTKVI